MKILKLKSGQERPYEFTGKVEYFNGNENYFRKGVLHREDGPAIIRGNGDRLWYINGYLHREDGPAVCTVNYKGWYINNRRYSRRDQW